MSQKCCRRDRFQVKSYPILCDYLLLKTVVGVIDLWSVCIGRQSKSFNDVKTVITNRRQCYKTSVDKRTNQRRCYNGPTGRVLMVGQWRMVDCEGLYNDSNKRDLCLIFFLPVRHFGIKQINLHVCKCSDIWKVLLIFPSAAFAAAVAWTKTQIVNNSK